MNIETIVDSARNLLPGQRKKAPQLTRDQAMAARPVRNPSLDWRENDDGEAVIVLPRRKDTMGKFLGWMFFVPEARPIVLDDVGTFVWTACDGEHPVSELVDMLCDEYKLGKREGEVSLTEFLKMLAKRGMIGFVIPQEIADELGEKDKKLLGLEEIGTTEEDLKQAQEAGESDEVDEEPDADQSEDDPDADGS